MSPYPFVHPRSHPAPARPASPLRSPIPALGALAVATTLACAVDPDPTATTAAAVEGGAVDSALAYPGVGVVRWPGGACSGTLVAPDQVLSAAHCFDGGGYDAPIEFFLTAPDGTARRYPAQGRVTMFPWFADPAEYVSPGNSDETARDVALITLATPVPFSVALPHPVAGVHGTPGCTFAGDGWGTLVGAGPTDDDAANVGLINFAASAGWNQSASADDGAARWVVDHAWGDQTGSANPGDSGGALFEGMPGATFGPEPVCGVTSGWTYAPPFADRTITAATQVGDTQAFLEANLHRFDRSCYVPAGVGGDRDGDRVADRCDVCPDLPDQHDDRDHDGRGDACDNCPDVANGDQRDTAVFGQLDRLGRPQLGGAPPPAGTLDGRVDPAWHVAFPGDACAPVPVTTLAVTGGSATADSPRTIPVRHQAVCVGGIGQSAPIATPLDATNVLRLDSFVGGATTLYGATRVAMCPCALGDSDAGCLLQCPRHNGLGAFFDDTRALAEAGWRNPSLYDPATGARLTGAGPLDAPGAGVMTTRHQALRAQAPGLPVAGAAPDHRAAVWKYWQDLHLPTPVDATVVVARPLFWTFTRATGATPPDAAAPFQELHAARRQDALRPALTESPAVALHVCDELLRERLVARTERIPNLGPCRRCGATATLRWYRDDLDLGPVVAVPGGGAAPLTTVATAAAAALLRDPALAVATATDGDAGLEPGAARAVVYDRDTHRVVATLMADADGRLDARDLGDDGATAPVLVSAAAAMSLRRGELVFVDAVDADGAPALRTVDLATGATAVRPLTVVGDGLVGPAVAAVYRASDDAYYLLARGHGKLGVYQVDAAGRLTLRLVFRDRDPAVAAALTLTDDDGLAITAAGDGWFGVVGVGVADDGALVPTVHVDGAAALTDGALLTAAGLVLETTTSLGATAPLTLAGHDGALVVHDLSDGAWQDLFGAAR